MAQHLLLLKQKGHRVHLLALVGVKPVLRQMVSFIYMLQAKNG